MNAKECHRKLTNELSGDSILWMIENRVWYLANDVDDDNTEEDTIHFTIIVLTF